MVVALLTAAGTGSRMGQDIPKQFIHVQNKPVIAYTLERFQNSPQIDEIVLVTLPNWFDFVWAYAHQFNITKLKWVVSGGETGAESIYNGIKKIEEVYQSEDTVVMIHDGNRAMVDNDIISNSLAVFAKHGSAVACVPCTEVVFRSNNGEEGNETIKREELLRTQTPHTYSLGKLLWAYGEADRRGLKSTAATCELMCMLGETTYFSRGSEKNIKITTLDDLDIFNALISTERYGWLK